LKSLHSEALEYLNLLEKKENRPSIYTRDAQRSAQNSIRQIHRRTYARYTDQCAKFYTPDTQMDIRQIHRPVQETRKIFAKLGSPLLAGELDSGHSDASKIPIVSVADFCPSRFMQIPLSRGLLQ